MLKQSKHTFEKGMSRDISKSKLSNGFYWDAENITTSNIENTSKYSISNKKGNSLVVSIPNITINYLTNKILYNTSDIYFNSSNINELSEEDILTVANQRIIGNSITRNSLILFTTNNTIDCIWEVGNILNNEHTITLLYIGKLNFTTEAPIQSLFNYENDKIQKIYFIDGVNQLRFFNKEDETLLFYNPDKFDIVSKYEVSQPIIESTNLEGNHTSGMIQYAYNLYNLYGSQTVISPLSDIKPLDKGSQGGGLVNEQIGKAVKLTISDLDTNFKYIKVYAIKYTSLNELPSISLIADEEINNYVEYSLIDGGLNIKNLTLEEFAFLGGNIIIPKHIEAKDNRLLLFNITEQPYLLNIDTRAYGHNSSGNATIRDGISINGDIVVSSVLSNIQPLYNVPETHDSVNYNYNVFKYQANGTILGAEGKFIKLKIVQKQEADLSDNSKNLRFLKDNELYRIGIHFYNKRGQKTEAKWICDFVAPEGNLEGYFNTIEVEIKQSAFSAYINSLNLTDDNIPVGFKIIRSTREEKDKTILTQGILTGMFLQTTEHLTDYNYFKLNESNRALQSKEEIKMPVITSRGFDDTMFPLNKTQHLLMLNERPVANNDDEDNQEIYRDDDPDYKRQHSWHYTKMFQLYSPDVLFNSKSLTNGLFLKQKGFVKHTNTNYWYKRLKLNDFTYSFDAQYTNVTYDTPNGDNPGLFKHTNLDGFPRAGLFGPNSGGSVDEDNTRISMGHFLFNRNYNTYIKATNQTLVDIEGKPEFTERGQGVTYYNNNANYKYRNNLKSVLSDKRKAEENGEYDSASLKSIQSEGNRCLTLMLNNNIAEENKYTLEQLKGSTGIVDTDGLLLSEIVRSDTYKYSNIPYGGHTYENKKRSVYLEIGNYIKFEDGYVSEIDNAGDTYVQKFKFARITKTDSAEQSKSNLQVTEIIEFPVETEINLYNRSDLSLLDWNNKFQPENTEYHNYNKVYSQQTNLLYNVADNIKLSKVFTFDNKILASKLKIPGEFIDSWSDVLVNEELYLDGKYGGINGVTSFNDTIFTFQDSAIARININPRIQVQGNDNVSIELGSGQILHDYNYLSTTSGTLNKWSIVNSPTGIYYIDLLNKSLNKIQSNLTDIGYVRAMDSFFNENLNVNILKYDNPLLHKGIAGVYDENTKDVIITVLQKQPRAFNSEGIIVNNPVQNIDNFSISFNDLESIYDSREVFLPEMYLTKGNLLFSVNEALNSVYKHYIGDYNTYFGQKVKSTITFLLNPDLEADKVFNNILYNSEVSLNGIDVPFKTFNYVTIWNEYQTSPKTELINARDKNLQRTFRMWRAQLPREIDSRNRIRNNWIFLKLEFDHPENYKFILHDIVLNYTV